MYLRVSSVSSSEKRFLDLHINFYSKRYLLKFFLQFCIKKQDNNFSHDWFQFTSLPQEMITIAMNNKLFQVLKKKQTEPHRKWKLFWKLQKFKRAVCLNLFNFYEKYWTKKVYLFNSIPTKSWKNQYSAYLRLQWKVCHNVVRE